MSGTEVPPANGDVKQPLLSVESVSKCYVTKAGRTQALDNVSLQVGAGEIVSLLGNNGAGKSTLMSISAGLVATDAGSVRVCGDAVTSGGGRPSRNLGLAPQEEALYPTLTARRNLEYFGRLSGLSGAELDQRVRRVADKLLLTSHLDAVAGTLSGGQRRRVHTALALMHEPPVLLLDEPTVGVDVDARSELLEFVRSTARSGAAVLYSTHQLHEVDALGASVVLISEGRVLASGSVEDLVHQHAPTVVELRFDRQDVKVPGLLDSSIDEMSTLPSGEVRITVRVDASVTHVASVVDQLSDESRFALVSAAVVRPSLEQAYLRLTRGAGAPSGGGCGADGVGVVS